MKFKLFLSQLFTLIMVSNGLSSQTVNSSTTQTPQSTVPPINYQNSITAPPITNPSTSLPGLPSTPLSASTLPGAPTSSQFTLPGNSTSVGNASLLQTVYPQPTTPTASSAAAPQPTYGTPQSTTSPGLKFAPKAFESIAPPTSYLPGIATIQNKTWVSTDFLYNLTSNIGVKVEIIKPEGQYVPLSENQLEQRISSLFQDAKIEPYAVQMNCQPPLPMFYVLIMAYPCEKRMIGFISAQLYEQAKPLRIDLDLNGVWQTITWERQALVASATSDFLQEVNEALTDMVLSFTERFKFYHPADERHCFPTH